MTPSELFDQMEPIDPPTARPTYPSALSDTNPGYNPQMVSPYPGPSGARSERQAYRGAGVPFTPFTAPTPISITSGGKSTAASISTSSGGGTTNTDPNAWHQGGDVTGFVKTLGSLDANDVSGIAGGDVTGFVKTLGSLDANDVSGIAGGVEQWRALATGGFQVDGYFAFGGSSVQPTPPGRDTFGYVFSNYDAVLLNPVNEIHIYQATNRITRTTPDANWLAGLTAAISAAATTLTVDRSDRFTSGMVVTIEAEQLLVNSTPTTATSVSVTRAYNSTTAAGHANGLGVFYISGGTIVAQGLGWDSRPMNGITVFSGMTLSDGVYRGQTANFVSELYFGTQSQNTNFSLQQGGYATTISQLAANNRLWVSYGYLVGQPLTTAGGKVSSLFNIWLLNQDSGTLSGDSVTETVDNLGAAQIKIDALGDYGKIKWNAAYLTEVIPGALGFYTTPTATSLTASITNSATSWPVVSSSGFTINDIVLCEGEMGLVTGIPDGTHLTVTRAQRGTTAFQHYGGTAPAEVGRTVTNLTATRRGYWDSTSLKIGTSNGLNAGQSIELNYDFVNGAGFIKAYDYAASTYKGIYFPVNANALSATPQLNGTGLGIFKVPALPLDVTVPSGTPGFSIRAYGTTGTPGILLGSSDGVSAGTGVEIRYDFTNALGALACIQRPSTYKPFYVDGSTVLLNANTFGKVGIGTSAPSIQLDVTVNTTPGFLIRAYGASGTPGVLIGSTTGVTGGGNGEGLELFHTLSTHISSLVAYDRNANAYLSATLDALKFSVNGTLAGTAGHPMGIGILPGSLATDAWLQLPAVDATTPKMVPLRITNGSAGLGTAVDGSFEYYGSKLYFSVGTTRYQLAPTSAGSGWTVGTAAGTGINTVGANAWIGTADNFPMAVSVDSVEGFRFDTNSANPRLLGGITSSDLTSGLGSVVLAAGMNLVSAATNAAVLGLSLGGGTRATLASSKSGSGTVRPLCFDVNSVEAARFEQNSSAPRFLSGLTSSDFSTAVTGAILSADAIFSLTAATNASYLGIKAVGGSYGILECGKTGSGTYLPLVVYAGGAEAYRTTTGQQTLFNETSALSGLSVMEIHATGTGAGAKSYPLILDIPSTSTAAQLVVSYNAGGQAAWFRDNVGTRLTDTGVFTIFGTTVTLSGTTSRMQTAGGNTTMNADGTLSLQTFTVATLPAAANGSVAYASDGKNLANDGAAVGTVVVGGGNGTIVARIAAFWVTMY